jgi:hypothetical protein
MSLGDGFPYGIRHPPTATREPNPGKLLACICARLTRVAFVLLNAFYCGARQPILVRAAD